jgi:hypothetical protein
VSVVHLLSLAQGKRPAQVFHASASIQVGLGGSISGPYEGKTDGKVQSVAEILSEDFRLVKLSPPVAAGVERNWDEEVWGRILQAGVCEVFPEPLSEGVPEVNGPLVFKAVDEFAHDSCTASSGDCTEEVPATVAAICAREGTLDFTGKRLGADLAAWTLDGENTFFARGAQVDARACAGTADGAVGGVKQGKGRAAGSLEEVEEVYKVEEVEGGWGGWGGEDI